MADERFQIVLREKEHWKAELLDYNKRLDRTIVLYLSAAYAAIGFQTAGKLDLSQALSDDSYVWVAFTFMFLNACIVLHGLSQSCWSMSIVKFIHLKLDNELLRLSGDSPPEDRCTKSTLRDVDALGCDDWRDDVKGVAIKARDLVTGLWILLVFASSIASLTFVNVPRFLMTHYVAGSLAITLLVLVHFRVVLHGIYLWYYVEQYHQLDVCFDQKRRATTRRIALGITAGLVLVSCLAAAFHQQEKLNNAVTPSSSSGVRGEEGANTQPRNASISTGPRT